MTGPFTVESLTTTGPEPTLTVRVPRSSLATAGLVRSARHAAMRQFHGERRDDEISTPDVKFSATLTVSGPSCARALSSPAHCVPCRFTEIGPFCVSTSRFPPLPDTEIGPFAAAALTAPETFVRAIGPLVARAVKLPSTS